MDSMKNMVQLVYDFEPKNDLEENAFSELLGGSAVYKAIKVFKDKKRLVEEAVKFVNRINDMFSIQDLF